MERSEIVELLKVVSAVYPHAKINDPKAMVTAWEMLLGEFSAESVYKAARLHMEKSKYFPSPSDIRDNIVRAKIVLDTPMVNAIEAPKENKRKEDYYLEELCKFVGVGYEEPDDNADLLCEFLPYEK